MVSTAGLEPARLSTLHSECSTSAYSVIWTYWLQAMGVMTSQLSGEFHACVVPKAGFEPAHLAILDFESSASANSAIWAYNTLYRIRTYISDLFWSQMFSV